MASERVNAPIASSDTEHHRFPTVPVTGDQPVGDEQHEGDDREHQCLRHQRDRCPDQRRVQREQEPGRIVVSTRASGGRSPSETPGKCGDRARGERAEHGTGPEVRVEGVDPEEQGPSECQHVGIDGRKADREHMAATDGRQPSEVAVFDRTRDRVVPGVVGARKERGWRREQQVRAHREGHDRGSADEEKLQAPRLACVLLLMRLGQFSGASAPSARRNAGLVVSSKSYAPFTSDTWVNAWGKFPSIRPATGSYSSEISPTSLTSPVRR